MRPYRQLRRVSHEDPDGHHGAGHRRGGDPYRGAGQGAEAPGPRHPHRLQRRRLRGGGGGGGHPPLSGPPQPAQRDRHEPGPAGAAGTHRPGAARRGPRPRPHSGVFVRTAAAQAALCLCHLLPRGVRGERGIEAAVQLGGAHPGGVGGHPGLSDGAVQPPRGADHPDHQRHRHGKIFPGGVRGGGPEGAGPGERPGGGPCQPPGPGRLPHRPAAHRPGPPAVRAGAGIAHPDHWRRRRL